MRGLPFPSRELSQDVGTPFSNDDIPIDPALAQPVEGIAEPVPEQPIPRTYSLSPRQYSLGPQGDPFAPPPLPYPLFPLDPPHHFDPSHPLDKPPPPPSKPKKKRKPRREEECGFCQGDDSRNKLGEQEKMVTCFECGRSGHPSCMQLADVADVVYSYPWKCVECKNCEVCQEKGDDERILFCDSCDRGWHTYCLSPPLTSEPPGKWSCPLCPPPPFVPPFAPDPNAVFDSEEGERKGVDEDVEGVEVEREVGRRRERGKGKGKGKGKDKANGRGKGKGKERQRASTTPATDSLSESDSPSLSSSSASSSSDGEEDRETTPRPRPRRPPKHNVKSKSRPRQSTSTSKPRQSIAAPTASTRRKRPSNLLTHPPKRLRLHSPHPPSPSQPIAPAPLVVRLRLPSRPLSRTHPATSTRKPRSTSRTRAHSTGGEDEDGDGGEKGMFDEWLTLEERDTMGTSITEGDKVRFEKSRVSAEDKLLPPPPPPSDVAVAGPSRPLRSTTAIHGIPLSPGPVPSTPGVGIPPTPLSGRFSPSLPSTPSGLPSTSTSSLVHSHSTHASHHASNSHTAATHPRIRSIRFGPYDIQTWYDAPFPEEYATSPSGAVWICEFCLKYVRSGFGGGRHRMKCKARHPPGDEIYRDGNISIFEVDGRKNKIYCQNLCLLSKLFLDHKSLFYDVEPFLFYVLTLTDDVGARFVGYFSKEKRSPREWNVSCIMTLPVRQRQGWGGLLIDFSYLLSKKEGRPGSPERPLSGLGALGYKAYWTLAIMRYLNEVEEGVRIRLEDISRATSMTLSDIYNTLVHLNMLHFPSTSSSHSSSSSPAPTSSSTPSSTRPRPLPGQSIKFPRGRKNGGIARRHVRTTPKADDAFPKSNGFGPAHTPNGSAHLHAADPSSDSAPAPFIPPASYEIRWDSTQVREWMEKWETRGGIRLKAEKLKWTPFVLTRRGDGGVVKAGEGEGKEGKGKQNATPATELSGVCQSPAPAPIPTLAPSPENENQSLEYVPAHDTVNPTPVTTGEPTPLSFSHSKTPLLKIQPRGKSKPTFTSTPTPVRRSVLTRTQSKTPSLVTPQFDSPRLTRSSSALAIVTSNLEEEEEVEDATPTLRKSLRSLRPARSSGHVAKPSEGEKKRLSNAKSVSPRKRRRVESPESESKGAEGEHEQEQEQESEGQDEGAKDGVNGDAELPNGRGHTKEPEVVQVENPPVHSTLSNGPTPHIDIVKDITGPTTNVDARTDHPRAETGVKLEDENENENVGTPLTGLTSAHSAPSDDTIFVDGVGGIGSKDDGVEMDVVQANDIVMNASDGNEHSSVPEPGSDKPAPAIAGSKIDASGTGDTPLDEDAGDSDLDAEGEPDIDVDADLGTMEFY